MINQLQLPIIDVMNVYQLATAIQKSVIVTPLIAYNVSYTAIFRDCLAQLNNLALVSPLT
jgi:hypothetical protein